MLKNKHNTRTSEIKVKIKGKLYEISNYKYIYLMFLPVLIMTIIFNYIPMIGVRYAFYEYTPFSSPTFIGLDNFKAILVSRKFIEAFRNTISLSLINLLLGTVVSIVFALLMNELYYKFFKSFVQTILYLPHFLSWVVTASIFYLMLSPNNGFVNQVTGFFGIKPIYFMVSEKWWTPIFFFINRWKETGWGTIIYLAALSGINMELYEAAAIDGAGRLKQTWHITLPGITNTILVVFILNLAKVLNLFEAVFVLMNPMVVSSAEVIQTYTYKVGLIQSDYGFSTAVGLFKSVISMVLVILADKLSKKIKGEGIL